MRYWKGDDYGGHQRVHGQLVKTSVFPFMHVGDCAIFDNYDRASGCNGAVQYWTTKGMKFRQKTTYPNGVRRLEVWRVR
jgi:hypothetical protein